MSDVVLLVLSYQEMGHGTAGIYCHVLTAMGLIFEWYSSILLVVFICKVFRKWLWVQLTFGYMPVGIYSVARF